MDNDINQQITDLKNFLMQQMPTKEELQTLRSEMAKEETIANLYTTIDRYMKQTGTFNQEKDILKYKVDRMETVLKEVAAKLNVKYEL